MNKSSNASARFFMLKDKIKFKKVSLKFVLGCIFFAVIPNLFLLMHLLKTGQSNNLHLVGDHAVTYAAIKQVQELNLWFGIPSFNGYSYPGPFWLIFLMPFRFVGLAFSSPDVAALLLARIALNCILLICYLQYARRIFSKSAAKASTLVLAIALLFSGKDGMSLWDPSLIAIPIAIMLLLLWSDGNRQLKLSTPWIATALGFIGSMSLVSFSIYLVCISFLALSWLRKRLISSLEYKSFKPLQRPRINLPIFAANLLLLSPLIIDFVFWNLTHIREYFYYREAVHAGQNQETTFTATYKLLFNMFSNDEFHTYALLLYLILIIWVIFLRIPLRKSFYLIGFFPFTLLISTIFIKFVSSSQYNPNHPYFYLYISLYLNTALLFGATLSYLEKSQFKSFRVALPSIILALISIFAYNFRGAYPLISTSSTVLYSGVVQNSEFNLAYNATGLLDGELVGLDIDFQKKNVSTKIDNLELPWRYGVGWSHYLQSKGLQTCIEKPKKSPLPYGTNIMTRYTFSNFCNESHPVNHSGEFFCDKRNQTLWLVVDNRLKYALDSCKS